MRLLPNDDFIMIGSRSHLQFQYGMLLYICSGVVVVLCLLATGLVYIQSTVSQARMRPI
jgi:hypothetical protein